MAQEISESENNNNKGFSFWESTGLTSLGQERLFWFHLGGNHQEDLSVVINGSIFFYFFPDKDTSLLSSINFLFEVRSKSTCFGNWRKTTLLQSKHFSFQVYFREKKSAVISAFLFLINKACESLVKCNLLNCLIWVLIDQYLSFKLWHFCDVSVSLLCAKFS